MSSQMRSEIWISFGFAASFFAAFLFTFLSPWNLSIDSIGAIWTIAISAAFVNHGIWEREMGLILGGSLSVLFTLISTVFCPDFVSLGYVALGISMAISSLLHTGKIRPQSIVGAYFALGGIVQLFSVLLSVSNLVSLMVWMVLVGLMLQKVAEEGRNPVMRSTGVFCVILSVIMYAFYPEFMFLSVILVLAGGVAFNIVYLFRRLGRTPRIGEIFSFATQALFRYGLKKPIDQYSVLAVLLEGNIGAENVLNDMISYLQPKSKLILLLGPTAPSQLPLKEETIGWITSLGSASELEYQVLSPEDPTMVNVFVNKSLNTVPKDMKPIILGDFLDNMIPHMDESLFYKYYSEFASTSRIKDYTVIFMVKADIHRDVDINIVKRFADVIIENREREEKGRLIREVRVSNKVDNIHTEWKKF